MREQEAGQLEVRGGLFFFFFFFYKASIRIYRTGNVRLHEDEEEARVFPVNNILL